MPKLETEGAPLQRAVDFSDALIGIKNGLRLRRLGWGDTENFVFLVAGSVFEVNRPPLLGIYAEGTEINYHGHIDMRNWNGQIGPWSPTHVDMLADDWVVVPEADQ